MRPGEGITRIADQALKVNQAPAHGRCRRLASAQHIDLGEDVLQMRLHGALADEKMPANFFVAHPESDLLEDDQFPLSQLGPGNVLGQFRRDCRWKILSPL